MVNLLKCKNKEISIFDEYSQLNIYDWLPNIPLPHHQQKCNIVEIKFTLRFTNCKIGQLAQLVQSASFTPRGSGVRTPHCPQKNSLRN